MKKLVLLIAAFLAIVPLYSQGEIDDESKILFRNERSLGLSLASSGYGLSYRYGKHIDGTVKNLFQAEFFYVMHQKEIKSTSLYFPNNAEFVYGKSNSLFALRLTYGLQKEVFSKRDKGGVAMRYYLKAGPIFGFLKPSFYEITYVLGEYVIEDFNTFDSHSNHVGIIIGSAGFFEGVEKTTIKPGLSFTLGGNFDYGTQDKFYNAIEAGVMIDFYLDKIDIMSDRLYEPQQLFVHLFLTYRFGRILDARFKD